MPLTAEASRTKQMLKVIKGMYAESTTYLDPCLSVTLSDWFQYFVMKALLHIPL